MVIRYLFNPGQSSSALTSSALGSNPTRTAEEIKTYLASSASILDVDGNGSSDALTDGIMAIRYLFNPGQSESALTSSALGSSPGRTNTEIKSYLQSISQ